MNVDFGSVPLGTSATRSATLPLSISIGDLPPAAVIYTGGNAQLNAALQLLGFAVPLTARQLAQRFPALTLTYRVLGVMLSGSHASDFAASPGNCIGSVGTSCNASAGFKPMVLGARRADMTPLIRNVVLAGGGLATAIATTLANYFEDVISSRLAFDVAGVGTAPVTVAPASLAFGNVENGVTAMPMKVTVTSTTSVPVKLLAARIAGAHAADFVLSSDGLSGRELAPGQSLSAMVSARPTRRGVLNAVFQVAHDAPLSPLGVTLSANGVAPVVAASVQTLDFGSVPVGTFAPERVIDLVNAGDAPLRVTAVSLSGTAAASFSIGDSNCLGVAIAPGSRAYIALSLSPVAPGIHNATMALVDNEAGKPFAITLSGNGVPSADVAVYLATDRWHVQAGSTLTYTVTARNGGPHSATGVIVSLRLPRCATFVSADKPCVSPPVGSTGSIVRRIGRLPSGASDAIVITVMTTTVPGSRMSAFARIMAATASLHPANDSAGIVTITEP